MQRVFTSLFSTLSLAILSCLIPVAAKAEARLALGEETSPSFLAQVTPDGTTATTVNQDGNNYMVEQGDRVGDNLFHSFEQFSVPTGGSAGFNNAADVANIFSRVTGGDISNIDGLLSASGAANLYLINPNGIIFGENARLDIGGSFFASTADSLLFEGDTEFSAANPQAAPLLEVSIPIGLSFRDNPGEIVNRSFAPDEANPSNFARLEVLPGKNLTLVGGDINFESGIVIARGGNIEIGGLSRAGTIGINEDGSLNFSEDITKANISLSNFANVNVQGIGGGNININAQNLSLESGELGESQIRAGISSNSTSAETQAGDITINVAENITLDQGGVINQVDSGGIGNSGNITINTGSLKLINAGRISASTVGQGNAGAVNVTATGDITADGQDLQGFPSEIISVVDSGAEGDAGGVSVSTTNLNLTNGGLISASTVGNGNAGAVNITATGDITADGQDLQGFPSGVTSLINPSAEGDAVGVTVSTTNLNLTNGGRISASTSGQGNAGAVNITAIGDITADGQDLGGSPSGITSGVNSGAEGDAGGVTVSTTNLNLTNGGRIAADTGGQGNAGAVNITATGNITADGEQSNGIPSRITSVVDSGAEGDAGGVSVSTTNLNLTNGGLISASTFGNGNAAVVNITATGDFTADGQDLQGFPSGITSRVNSGAEGDAGGVSVSTTNLNLTNGGRVDASTGGRGNAGAVEVTATGDITADGEDSKGSSSGITSGVNPDAEGNAGGVRISTTNLSLTNGGQVSASTFGRGNAGAIELTASESIFIDGFIERFRSGISANALNQNGDGGNIFINTDSLTVANGGTIEAGNFDSLRMFSPGTGLPGSINVEANSIDLERGVILAATQSPSGEGANITLASDSVTLQDNSLISAQAVENANGGNVTIDADEGFILGFPNGNNDIVANAQQGIGGRINIDTQAIFGLEERSSTPPNQTNDIDASSEFGLQGDFTLNTPDFDPTSGLLELPASVGDASDQISQNPCQQGVGSEFIVTGKGGLPPNPTDSLNSAGVEVGLVEPLLGQREKETREQGDDTVTEAVPAMGWVFNDRGEVTLTAYSNIDGETERSHLTLNTCNSYNPK